MDYFDLKKIMANEDVASRNPELAEEIKNVAKPSKYHNVVTGDFSGERYGSKKEEQDAADFRMQVFAREIYAYIHHLVVDLPGGVKMELDHFIITKDLKIEVYETKALNKKGKFIKTRDWRNKQKQFEDKYEIQIKLI